MKHLKVMTTEKPAAAEEMAWISIKNLLGAPLTPAQQDWVVTQINNWLTK